jgi:hypothetical protein
MRPTRALRETHSVQHLHGFLRRCSFAHQSSTVGSRQQASSRRHAVLSSAHFCTTSRMRSPPARDQVVDVQFCDTEPVRPHEYTAGRWLKQDKLQRDVRHLDSDFAALTAKAVALCPRARSVSACTKLEGGFNKAFLYTMDGGERIVARVPTHIAGPRRLTTNSEVATIAYSKTVL